MDRHVNKWPVLPGNGLILLTQNEPPSPPRMIGVREQGWLALIKRTRPRPANGGCGVGKQFRCVKVAWPEVDLNTSFGRVVTRGMILSRLLRDRVNAGECKHSKNCMVLDAVPIHEE